MLTRRAMLAASAATAIAAPGLDAAAASPAGIIVMAKQIDDIVSLDPAESYEFTDNEVDANCYRKLVQPNPDDPTKLVGDLAESWTISQDGLTLTFTLRTDAMFDSGNPVTASDVAFSLNRVILLDKTPAFILGQFGFTKDNVANLIKATDPKTLVVTLPAKQAPSFVLACLSANVGCIVEKATAMAHAQGDDLGYAWLKTNSAGAGPFRLTNWIASDRVVLDVNPHYSPAPAVKRIVLRHVPEPAAQLLLLNRGDADIARNLGDDQLKTLTGQADYKTVAIPQMLSLYVAMNESVPEFAKPEVRQAIKWAIDAQAIARNITPNTWTASESFLPIGIPGALKDLPFSKDIDRAKKLLASAGLPDGFSVTMDFISASPYSEIAQAIQADLAAIGIKVQLIPGEQKQVITKTRARQHQLAVLYWGADYFDANSNAQGFCANPDDSDKSTLKIIAWRNHFVDKQLTDEVTEAAIETDADRRLAIYVVMQKQFWERAPFAFLLQRKEVAALRSNVSGFVLGPMVDYTRYGGLTKT